MAWTAPPTFSSGAVLTATQLNILSDDLEYLAGFVTGANSAMTSVQLDADGDAFGIYRHLHRYMHLRYKVTDDIKIYLSADGSSWTLVYHDGTPAGIDETAVADLDSYGLTVGQLYNVKITMDSDDGQPRIIYYIYESDTL